MRIEQRVEDVLRKHGVELYAVSYPRLDTVEITTEWPMPVALWQDLEHLLDPKVNIVGKLFPETLGSLHLKVLALSGDREHVLKTVWKNFKKRSVDKLNVEQLKRLVEILQSEL